MPNDEKNSLALTLAVQEQREDGSRTLRDSMIRTALDEGNSVADIAEALDLTPQAVYKIQAQQGAEPLGPQGAAANGRAVVVALDQMTDAVAFEELVAPLIIEVDPAAIPLGGPGDRGRDAADPDSEVIFTISLDRQWKRKVESDLAKIKRNGYSPKRVFSVTNRRTSRKAVEKLIESAASDGIALTVLDQKWLVAELNRHDRLHLRTGILNIAPPRSPSFLTSDAYRRLLNGRPHLTGFDVHFTGRAAETTRAMELLERDRFVLLSGAGGYGKTRLALELAQNDDGPWRFIDTDMPFTPESISELPVSSRLVVVIDNAHRRDGLGQILTALANLKFGVPRIVMLTRPGHVEQLSGQLAASSVGPLESSRVVEIGPLNWRSMATVLKAKPLEIESPEQRGAIIDLAEGNPQIAVIAARVATERRSVIGLNGDELLQRYIAYLIPTAMPFGSDGRRQRQLLAVIAALDGIEDDDDAMIGEIGEMLRMTPEKVRDELDQLAETGLVIGDRNRHRIKPDLLAEHVLFALTLTDRWQLSIDYRLIFERFGDRHLARLAKAIGALPFSLFDDDVTERLWSFERAISSAVEGSDPIYAATLVREISHGRPTVAKSLASKLLKSAADLDAGTREKLIDRLREGAMRMSDFERSWNLLLDLGAASGDLATAQKAVGEAMSDTYQRIPEGDKASGAILAAVQDSLAAETRRFWDRGGPGAASAVALAIGPMLRVTFGVTRTSADNPMSIEIGHRILPASTYTEKVVTMGGSLAAEILPQLKSAEQLKLLEAVGAAANTAAGFSGSMGSKAPLEGRVLLDGALDPIDSGLADLFFELAMPARRSAYDYLLKRARYRRKLAEEVNKENPDDKETRFPPVKVPTPDKDLEDFLLVINNTQVGPPEEDRLGIREQFERDQARAYLRAEELRMDPNWRRTVDQWTAWWEQRLELEKQPALGTKVGMVFEALAQADRELGIKLIDHLVATDSELRGSSAAAMTALIDQASDAHWKRWLDADAITRSTLARALANFDEEIAAEPMRRLAADPDDHVRSSAMSALAFSIDLDQWRIDLSLEALAAYPDIEAIDQILHMADDRAGAEDGNATTFTPHQLGLLESAILATASRNRIGAYHLTDALRRVEGSIEGLAMRWIWARVDEFERIESRRDLSNFWDIDFLEDDLAQLVSSVATDSDLDVVLKRFERVSNGSPALQDLAKVIGWIDGGSVKVTKLMVHLLNDKEEAGYRARAYLMELPVNDEQLDRRALAFARELDEPLPALLALIDGSLPSTWSGSYVPHLERGLETAKRWSESEDQRLLQAGLEASKVLEKRVRSWEERERIEELEFEYT